MVVHEIHHKINPNAEDMMLRQTKCTHQHNYIHKIRCLFCLCVLMFCTDDCYSIPLHTLVTDTIDRCGGSTELIRILNRLEVCASADTLARFIQHKVEEHQRRVLNMIV